MRGITDKRSQNRFIDGINNNVNLYLRRECFYVADKKA